MNSSDDEEPCYKKPFVVFLILLSIGLGIMFVPLLIQKYINSRRSTLTEQQKTDSANKRRELIESSLITRPWTVDDVTIETIDDQEATQQSITPEDTLPDPSSSKRVDEGLEEPTGTECAICLAYFEEGQLVTESHNLACRHHFHVSCLEQWLMKHENCPVCRNNYLLQTI